MSLVKLKLEIDLLCYVVRKVGFVSSTMVKIGIVSDKMITRYNSYLRQAEAKLSADGEAGDGLAAEHRLGNLGRAAVARRRQQRRHRPLSCDDARVVVWALELLLLLPELVLQEYPSE